MGRERIFPEAWRHELYAELPVPRDWHKEYVKGTVIAESYREAGWEYLINSGKVRPCKWYRSCPLGRYTEAGKLEHYWVENYCLVRNRHCKRYQMEEKGEYHPDNMMPDGSIREDLGEGEPAET
jgi:hypothetical protein